MYFCLVHSLIRFLFWAESTDLFDSSFILKSLNPILSIGSSPITSIVIVVFIVGLQSCADGPKQGEADSYTELEEKAESCLVCHNQLKGYSAYHNPENIGCTVCHLGQPGEFDKEAAHASMVLIPGNLTDAAQTCGTCHPSELDKIKASLMTTNSGLVAVDKFVFDEARAPDGHYDIRNIGHSSADQHLRNLCANCHLGAEKSNLGPISELSRGGGCNACHLNYSKSAEEELTHYLSSGKQVLPSFHPATNIQVGDTHCFGCHSRSSRISTNYMGWQETLISEQDVKADIGYKAFQDGRVYKQQSEDVHHASGMLCVDCHGVGDVMGDGQTYTHEENAVHLACNDCHYKEEPNTIDFENLDRESLLVFSHRGFEHEAKPMLMRAQDSTALVNTYLEGGKTFLIGKADKIIRNIAPQPEACSRDAAHQDLTCSSCHSQWAPRCIGCHNSFEKNDPMAYDLLEKKVAKSGWVEHIYEFSADLPALGVRERDGTRHIEPAIPGMILTIDHDSYDQDSLSGTTFRRLYAPNSPHTIGKESRTCVSCHISPLAIGYGKGILDFDTSGNENAWTFTPEYAQNGNDGLPEDAWIPFLGLPRDEVFSTRSDFRPFDLDEQKRILTVGACLKCHAPDAPMMQRSLSSGIKPLLLERSEQCELPKFD